MSGRAWRGDAAGRTGACADLYAITLTDISPLKAAEDDLRNQYRIIAELSNNILAQAEDLRDYSEQLENRVRERTLELHDANMDAIYMLAIASESKDEDTGRHVRRIQHYSAALARELGFPRSEAERIGYSAILHDVGKIHVPDHILKKPGPLTPDERRAIQEHTTAGEHILTAKPFFATARMIARSHHENWDGSGYPDRTGQSDIPIEARIVHLADVYDALTTPRVYKLAWTAHDAQKVIEESTGKMFDPDIVKAFTSLRARQDLNPDT
jgi:putative two-component system response regulator